MPNPVVVTISSLGLSSSGVGIVLIDMNALARDDAPSYFIECLLYNVPDQLFKPKLALTYTGILSWLETARTKKFKCQNGRVLLFGRGLEQWTGDKARALVKALRELWAESRRGCFEVCGFRSSEVCGSIKLPMSSMCIIVFGGNSCQTASSEHLHRNPMPNAKRN